MGNPAETAYLSVRDGKLSNTVQLVEFGQEKLQFTPFWGGPKLLCLDGLRAGTIESHNFFVLGPILVKFHIRTQLIESFPPMFRSWWWAEEKLHFTQFHTLCQLKRDEVLFPPLPISLADRKGLKNLPRQIFSACVKFGGNPCRDVDTLHFYAHTDRQTDRHTHTRMKLYIRYYIYI